MKKIQIQKRNVYGEKIHTNKKLSIKKKYI